MRPEKRGGAGAAFVHLLHGAREHSITLREEEKKEPREEEELTSSTVPTC